MSTINKVNIASLSDANLTVDGILKELHISFELKTIQFVVEIIKQSVDQRVGTITDVHRVSANNNDRIKVVNQDGSPSMIPVLNAEGDPIQDLVSPAEEILGPAVDENGNPLLDGDGQPMVDESGNPIQMVIGYTEPVYQTRMMQETIGEFDYWVIQFPSLIQALQAALFRNLDPSQAGQLTYVKE